MICAEQRARVSTVVSDVETENMEMVRFHIAKLMEFGVDDAMFSNVRNEMEQQVQWLSSLVLLCVVGVLPNECDPLCSQGKGAGAADSGSENRVSANLEMTMI